MFKQSYMIYYDKSDFDIADDLRSYSAGVLPETWVRVQLKDFEAVYVPVSRNIYTVREKGIGIFLDATQIGLPPAAEIIPHLLHYVGDQDMKACFGSNRIGVSNKAVYFVWVLYCYHYKQDNPYAHESDRQSIVMMNKDLKGHLLHQPSRVSCMFLGGHNSGGYKGYTFSFTEYPEFYEWLKTLNCQSIDRVAKKYDIYDYDEMWKVVQQLWVEDLVRI